MGLKAQMKVVVTGGAGMLAASLIPLLKKAKKEVVPFSKHALDIRDLGASREKLFKIKPDVIINCAAYTSVDRAEDEEKDAFSVNAFGAANIAVISKELNARLIHISTDFVFDGTKNTPYTEDDSPCPLSVYGRSKLKGEEEIRRINGDFIIIRTSWLYGRNGANFVTKIIELLRLKEELSVVYDQIGAPTYTRDLSDAIINLMEHAPSGTYHFSNEGVASWYDFAYRIMEEVRMLGLELKTKRFIPILTHEYPTRAKRPPYSVLDKHKYKKTTGKIIPHWMDSLSEFIKGEFEQ